MRWENNSILFTGKMKDIYPLFLLINLEIEKHLLLINKKE